MRSDVAEKEQQFQDGMRIEPQRRAQQHFDVLLEDRVGIDRREAARRDRVQQYAGRSGRTQQTGDEYVGVKHRPTHAELSLPFE